MQPQNEKMLAPWKKSYDKPRQYIKKQRIAFLSDILAKRQWSQLFSGLRYAAQGRQEEERCRKVGQERQRSSEQIWGQGQKEEVVQRQSSGQAQ